MTEALWWTFKFCGKELVRRAMRCKKIASVTAPRVVLCTLLIYTTLINFKVRHFYQAGCSDDNSTVYLEELCRNYSKRLISGSLCSPLCDTHELQFDKCLGHGVKLHVLRAMWNGSKVILKTPNALGTHSVLKLLTLTSKPLNEDFKMTREEFITLANSSVFHGIAGRTYTSRTIEVLHQILVECDVGGDGILQLTESIVCWELVETGEFMLHLLLRDSSATLDVYGTCGNMYALQYADSTPYAGDISDSRPWSLRARLAVAILELVQSIEQTPYGTLYLCDVLEDNIGLVKKSGDQYEAKAIDLDTAMFKNMLLSWLKYKYQTGETCTKDNDCGLNYANCLGECDLVTGTCTGNLTSSNLLIMCRVFFMETRYSPRNLLYNPPANIVDSLNALLEKCSKPGLSQIDWDLLREFKSVLLNSTESQHD